MPTLHPWFSLLSSGRELKIHLAYQLLWAVVSFSSVPCIKNVPVGLICTSSNVQTQLRNKIYGKIAEVTELALI